MRASSAGWAGLLNGRLGWTAIASTFLSISPPKGIIELRAGCGHDRHDIDPQAATGPNDMIEKNFREQIRLVHSAAIQGQVRQNKTPGAARCSCRSVRKPIPRCR